MTYGIRTFVGPKIIRVEMDEKLFDRVRAAQTTLRVQLNIEQRFDIALENYIEVESGIARTLVTHTLRSGKMFEPSDDTPSVFDRLLINLLSSAMGYKAEVLRYKATEGTLTGSKLFDELRSNSMEYRAMEGLRNLVQHFSLLIKDWGLHSAFIDGDNGSKKRRYSVSLELDTTEIAKGMTRDKDKPALIALQSMTTKDNKVPLIPLIRKYIEDIARVHKGIRDTHKTEFESAYLAISEARAIGATAGASSTQYMVAFRSGDDGESLEEVHLGEGLAASIKALHAKNRVPLLNYGTVELFI